MNSRAQNEKKFGHGEKFPVRRNVTQPRKWEYRTALITAAVTGKTDVRTAF